MYADNVARTLAGVFGFAQLRPGQQQVVDTVLAGRSAAAIFPTGSGKSLCYQLPALHLPHLTLVISPLIALMQDQLAFLRSKGIAAAALDSSLEQHERQQVMQQLRNNELKILMISVERLKNERFRQFLSGIPISLLVIDEAHCISEWGHNFRPDYLKLPHYCQQFNIPQVLLLTATATAKVIADMQQKFTIAPDDVVVTGFYRSNLTLAVQPCAEADKHEQLLAQLTTLPQPAIVYVTLQHTADTVADFLCRQGMNAKAYHAGMDSELRRTIQQGFMAGEYDCIVATIAFGMGVDKADIRTVIHYDLPKSIENYSQEIGRAGRDGNTAYCTVLANRETLPVLENFIYGDTPESEAIAAVIAQIATHNEQGLWEVMINRLSQQCNIRQLPLKTLLVYLELQGIISPQYSYFADYRFKCLRPEAQIIAAFQGERQQFVSALFSASAKSRIWHTVDFTALWQAYGAERKRAVAALDYFAEQGWIELESKQMTEVFQVTAPQQLNEAAGQQLTAELAGLFAAKEQGDIARIHQMLSLFESRQCLSHGLAVYFSDHQAPHICGHCSVCQGHGAILPAPTDSPLPPLNTLQMWCQPLQAAGQAQGLAISAGTLARFLCGISSPLSGRLKAGKMPGFGQLSRYPFARVLEAVNACL